MGRPVPAPLIPLERKSRNHENPRKEHLNPALPEFMMGLPEGWITDIPGLTYHDKLRLSGNAVVPQQAALALEILWA
jgi:DNA (cytosine-5)-methyltransferase 1